ncbi:flavin reductase [Photobacterium aquae]|uniref:Flavin reductase n=1 Tax=Photobacterium aquae TaxID=1195763 RepID=A0A0J1GX08_9GAMM|nr:SDR family oxidoreductase [Photobacterium aquae]KLV04198.1 flavin reductase [Photobacterium aquae]
MKHLVLFGASRGLGFAIAKHYRELGGSVTAMVRQPESAEALQALGVDVVAGDALSISEIEHVLSTAEKDSWVISTMGSFGAEYPVDYTGHRNLIDSLEHFGISRFLMVSSLGCGDSWATLSERARQAFGQAVREKSLAESWLQTSQLAFTILRPGGLKDGSSTGLGELSQGKEVHGLITRGEVARLAIELLNRSESVGQVYACVDPHYV